MALLAGEILTADDLNAGPASYLPALTASTTSPTLGAGSSVTGWYYRIGRIVVGGAIITFGTSGVAAGAGTYQVSLPPIAADITLPIANALLGRGTSIGAASLRNSGTVGESCTVQLRTADLAVMQSPAGAFVTDAAPWVWGTNDAMSLQFVYLAV